MALSIHTSNVRLYQGADGLDVTAKSAAGVGVVLAPSTALLRRYHPRWGGRFDWEAYSEEYLQLLCDRRRRNRAPFDEILRLRTVTLLCYCRVASRCHRTLAADFLTKIAPGVVYHGERKAAPPPKPSNSGNLELLGKQELLFR